MTFRTLEKDDYEEPCCPLSGPGDIKPIPVARVMEKLDGFLERNDYSAAERHLSYWYREAEQSGDRRGMLSVTNEQVGLYRKLGKKEEALSAAKGALNLAETIGIDGTVSMGTTLINAATAYNAFGEPAAAESLYERAREIYESSLAADDERLGGLYNNMALALTALGDHSRAEELFNMALGIMSKARNGEAEMAVTYLNLCDLVSAKLGPEEAEKTVESHVERAAELLDTPTLPRNGYYAFVCEKCAPAMDYYGFFAAAVELRRRAKEIYDRT